MAVLALDLRRRVQSCTGSGWQPQTVRTTLQKYGAFGFWNNLAQGSTPWTNNSYASKQVDYDCAGTGTEIYRVVIDAYITGGRQMISAQSADYYYTTC